MYFHDVMCINNCVLYNDLNVCNIHHTCMTIDVYISESEPSAHIVVEQDT